MVGHPKYIEFVDGSIVIFAPELLHSDVARRAERAVRSAGMVSFPKRPGGSFWGHSTTLNMDADITLSAQERSFWGGTLPLDQKALLDWRFVMVATDPDLVIPWCNNVEPAPWTSLIDDQGQRSTLPLPPGTTVVETALFSGVLNPVRGIRTLDDPCSDVQHDVASC